MSSNLRKPRGSWQEVKHAPRGPTSLLRDATVMPWAVAMCWPVDVADTAAAIKIIVYHIFLGHILT